ncbi:protein-disulfide reductase DsbD domain-containing protein [Aliiroseovarius sp.]|uniref:protein-disulfide reductase DsbD family protein n=1 Tax=Aliiroseovarius sp. TaxID=1872442 RepID=UPI002637DF55|nr:protein-disulfide reductase DsbD domain-containing protein [Aliiroseovarius sp.]
MILTFVLAWVLFNSGSGLAASSEEFTSKPVAARIITAQDGVPPGAETLSAGLSLKLADGWKTYWRSPGEVGIPPKIDWAGSENVADVEMLWPAPERFTAFGIENFGYHEEVVFPLNITLEEPGKPVDLAGAVKLLVCSEVCVPQNFDLSLSLPLGTSIDSLSAGRISDFLARVPLEGDQTGITRAIASVDVDQTALTLEMESTTAFEAPDVFAELGEGTALGKPDIRLGDGGRRLWAQIPILTVLEEKYHDPVLTVTDGPGRALTLTPQLDPVPPKPPFNLEQLVPGLDQLAWIAIIAFLGGMILNIMPCVLPVLSIKLSSAIKAHGRDTGSVRRGFLVAAAGVMVFMWALAAILFVLQQFGFAVGWGLQFQNPIFLTLMFLVLAVFSANLFGLFEFRLPSGLQSRLAGAGGSSGYGADFATGFFGAVLATPCSAPFLGTAIAFALAGRGVDILIVFTALGLGLAAPYLLVAALPRLVTLLPKPGRWMIWLKLVLGLLLLGTSLWLAWVLVGVAGPQAAAAVIGSTFILMVILSSRPSPSLMRRASVLLFIALPLLSAAYLSRTAQPAQSIADSVINWVVFDRGDIARRVSRGEVVFLDVTADWCLTCKANKALVLERDPVLTALRGDRTVAMQADWTQPDERIARFLEANNRYGIPFNAVYGPGAPNGIVLSEILSSQEVLAALETARGSGVQSSTLSLGQ